MAEEIKTIGDLIAGFESVEIADVEVSRIDLGYPDIEPFYPDDGPHGIPTPAPIESRSFILSFTLKDLDRKAIISYTEQAST